jgi:hypothetical protein
MSAATPATNGSGFTERPVQEAYDELVRELGVRDRCFPQWVKEGRIAHSDARDRYDRLKSAVHYLEASYAKELVKPGDDKPDFKP